MTSYISELEVSLNEVDEQNLFSRGFKKINVDLNKGAMGKYVYIWYKTGSTPITKIQFSFTTEMEDGLTGAGYTKVDKDLNAGAGGDFIYLWFSGGSGEYDIPIVDIDVTTDEKNEACKFTIGWERQECDLNRGAQGNWIHMWVKREKPTYICDVTVTDCFGLDTHLLQNGYIRLDEDTNRGSGGSFVFIWYRQTTDPKRAITDLKVSTNDEEYQQYQQLNYSPASVNLNEDTKGEREFLWYKRGGGSSSVKAVVLLVNMAAVVRYERAGITVIEKNLNKGGKGDCMFLCFYQ